MSNERDVARLLQSAFDDVDSVGVSRPDLIRLWSLDVQWFTPAEAEQVVDRLCERGWLEIDSESITVSSGVTLVPPGLGWRPIIRRMLEPPECPTATASLESSASRQQPTTALVRSSKPDPTSAFSTPRVIAGTPSPTAEPRDPTRFSRPTVSGTALGAASGGPREQLVDRAEGSIPVLIDLIAKESGLTNREVVRRAQRKRRALGPVTLWMALALVAREQGLDMERVAAAIERAAS
mgnify:FL=1